MLFLQKTLRAFPVYLRVQVNTGFRYPQHSNVVPAKKFHIVGQNLPHLYLIKYTSGNSGSQEIRLVYSMT